MNYLTYYNMCSCVTCHQIYIVSVKITFCTIPLVCPYAHVRSDLALNYLLTYLHIRYIL